MKNKKFIISQLRPLALDAQPTTDEEIQVVEMASKSEEELAKLSVLELLKLTQQVKEIPTFDETNLSFIRRMGGRY